MGMTIEAAVFVYIGIDLMALLSLPIGDNRQTRQHFKAWAQKYMTAHDDQPYKYSADDLYAARCSLLHNYSSEADIHDGTELKKFGYTDGGKHLINEEISEHLVLIGVKSFVNDFIIGVEQFIKNALSDPDLKSKIDSRVLKTFSDYSIVT